MEKRLILSFVLSFAILYLWSFLFAPKSEFDDLPQTSEEQIIDVVKEDTTSPPKDSEKKLYPEELISFESDSFLVKSTNQNASIVDITSKNEDIHLPLVNIGGFTLGSHPYELVEESQNSITYQTTHQSLTITQHFFTQDPHQIEHTLSITNTSDNSISLDSPIQAFTFDLDKLDSDDQRTNTLMEVAAKLPTSIYRLKGKTKFHDKHNNSFENPDWFAFRDQYYCLIYDPLFDLSSGQLSVQSEQQLSISFNPKYTNLDPGQSTRFKAKIYFGPQDTKLLDSLDNGYDDLVSFKIGGFFDVMAFGLTDVIAKIMLQYMNFLYSFLSNWGLVIIVFSISIFALTYPLTKKSMDSMQKMQKLQPKLNELKQKYKDRHLKDDG
jgi:hypothetical protein